MRDDQDDYMWNQAAALMRVIQWAGVALVLAVIVAQLTGWGR